MLKLSEFSNRLLALREEHNWSKTTVAKKLGLSVQRYANWEYGTREPDLENLTAIAQLYGVSTDYLTGQSNDRDKKAVDLETDPVVLNYGGRPVSDEDMDIIKAILERHKSGDTHYE
ncbi:helix-turn-helix domain-containing protein [Lactobacillus hominis]